jgi:hypothetical protein
MKPVTCSRCGGQGRVKRKDGANARCQGCGGVGERYPVAGNTRGRRTASPWGLTPLTTTPRALARWDWRGAAEKIAAVNDVRAAKGAPLLKVPKMAISEKDRTPEYLEQAAARWEAFADAAERNGRPEATTRAARKAAEELRQQALKQRGGG